MKKTLLTTLILGIVAIGCGKIEVGDSNHTVKHEISIDNLHKEIIAACQDAYDTNVEVNDCIQDTLKSVLIMLQNGELVLPTSN